MNLQFLKTIFIKLSLFARKYLSAPPSSMENGRLFSIGGTLYSPPKSNRMHANNKNANVFFVII